VVDLYGRNLLGRVFDTIFFPAHLLFGVDFFYFFKLFSATLFAVFLCIVHRYLMARIAASGGRRGGVMVSLLVAFAVLVLLPWTNQVRAVCYELPGFVGFVVLAEVFALLPGVLAGREAAGHGAVVPAAMLLPLGFVAAFSLEGDAAIILAALAVAWVLARPWRQAGWVRREVTMISAATALFCLVALCMTAVFSARAGVSKNFIPVRQLTGFLLAHGDAPDPLSWDFAQWLAAGAVGLAVIWAFRAQFAVWCGFAPASDPNVVFWARGAAQLALVTCVTMFLVALICMETDQDFFSFQSYPWGGLLLIPMFFAVPAAVVPLDWGFEGVFAADAVRQFVMLLLMSWMAVAVTGQAQSGYQESVRVQAGYEAALAHAGPVVDSGLSLDGVEMQKRPLPTADSPGWFVQGYGVLFEKYYGVQTGVVFR
jgi:hypothetical protein